MWFGTGDGLNKYDGYEFVVYKHDAEDPTSLSDDEVSALYQDRSGDLWIGTQNGLNRLDRTTGAFTRYPHDPEDPDGLSWPVVLAIHEDRTGTLWVGTGGGGLDRLDRATNVFAHYRHDPDDPNTLSGDSVWTIYEDRSGELWLGTDGGLDRFDRTTGTFVHYRQKPNDPQSLSDNRVRVILEDRQGALWVGTDGGGLDRMDRHSGTLIHYEHSAGDPHSLSSNQVWAILEDGAGRLWVGTIDGLNLFVPSRAGELAPDRGHFARYRHDPDDPHSLSDNVINSIYEDRSGMLWIGTGLGGLSKYNRVTDRFALYQHRANAPNSLSDNAVYAIYEDQSGSLWVGTKYGGLNRLDRQTGTFTVYRHDRADDDSLSSDQVRTILQDRTGALWVGTRYGGLDRFDPRTETFAHYRHDPHDPSSLSEDWVSTIYKDRSGTLWVGTFNRGLNRFDRATGAFYRYQHDPNDPSSINSENVRSIFEDRQGVLWVGTSGGGISLLDPDNGRFVAHYVHDPDDPRSLSSNDSVLSIYEDATGTIWIASYGGGLNRFDPATQTFAHYTEKDGLADDIVYCTLADSAGFLWISTNRGLSRFDPRTERFRNYDVSDGLQSNEFNYGACFQSDGGEMFFGGIGGFNGFYPEQVKDNPHVPPIAITDLSIFNQTVRTDLPADEQIRLSYKENFVSFEFAALDYNAPEKNQYAYMMEGFDEDWVYAGTRRHTDYTNLRGGEYVFRVKGSNSDGVWNTEGTAIQIAVTPPVWERWWFRGSVALVLLGSAIGGVRLRIRSLEAQSRKLESQVKESTREMEQRTQELESLNAISAVVSRSLDLQEILNNALDKTLEVTGLEAGGIYLLQKDAGSLRIIAHQGLGTQFVAEIDDLGIGEGFSGRVVQTGAPLIVRSLSMDPRLTRLAVRDAGFDSVAIAPLVSRGEVLGSLFVITRDDREFSQQDVKLLTAIGHQVGVAIDNARLYEQAQELAVVEERQRLARELHDAVSQTLFSTSLIAEVLPRIWEHNREEGWRRLEEIRQLTRGALAEMRTLLLELRPAALIEVELGDLLRQLAEGTIGRARVPVTVRTRGECSQLSPDVKVALYRIAQEALNNVAKHAEASQATVHLDCQPDVVKLRIADDGRGFDVDEISPHHLGLRFMRERADAIGATLEIESKPGLGTQIVALWGKDERQGMENKR